MKIYRKKQNIAYIFSLTISIILLISIIVEFLLKGQFSWALTVQLVTMAIPVVLLLRHQLNYAKLDSSKLIIANTTNRAKDKTYLLNEVDSIFLKKINFSGYLIKIKRNNNIETFPLSLFGETQYLELKGDLEEMNLYKEI